MNDLVLKKEEIWHLYMLLFCPYHQFNEKCAVCRKLKKEIKEILKYD